MASTKAALKAAKAALDAHKYEEAAVEARKVLEAHPKHYHANVFLGLALDKQDKSEESEQAYQVAAASKRDDPLVWQGLINLYEKQGSKKLDDYAGAVRELAQIYAGVDDKHRCQSVVDKYVGYAKHHGTRMQIRHAYDIMVPGSPVYDYLEGRIPKPEFTYMRIAELIEADEEEAISRLIAERRTRLGAKISQVTVEVKREVYMSSDLEGLYQGIIDYTHDDDLRRQYEEKLLQRKYNILSVLPTQYKDLKRQEVQKLAEGMVIIKAPVELAWRIELEWRNVETMQEWDVILLRQYIELFPEHGLGKVLRGFFSSEICPFPSVKASTEKNKDGELESDLGSMNVEDRLFLMTEGLEESSKSVLAHRIMAEYYLYLEEWASTVETARRALDLISQEETYTGVRFQNRLDGTNIVLATALVQYQMPKYHSEARAIFQDILARKPGNVSALTGVGLILEEEEDFEGAIDFLSRALKEHPTLKMKSEAAWCKSLIGDHEHALKELEECLTELNVTDERSKLLKAELLYRIGSCMWYLDTSKAARRNRNGAYARFLQSLQLNLNYAPTYTTLGIFYADYARDRKRARKCFEKAFELSPSEVYAAERLARAFADVGDWDLVEVVAQRVVDSGKVRPPPSSKKKPISWPFAALGVCHLNHQDYAKAVPAFNSALRIEPNNYNCLVGLGEAYHNSGRFVAATHVFRECQKHEKNVKAEDVWFARYMLANVHRDLGEFDDAIAAYEEVLEQKPDEYGVVIALLQTLVESAWHSLALGLFGRGAESAGKAINLARGLVESRPHAFNLWKALGEACSIYASIGGYVKQMPHKTVLDILEIGAHDGTFNYLSDVDHVELDGGKEVNVAHSTDAATAFALNNAILSQKKGIAVSSKDIYAQAVAWYNLGWTEYRAHATLVGTRDEQALRSSKYLRAAVRCFKRAIELEARNAEFWNALGIVTTPLNARVAQHAFVRSLYLNDKSAQVWTNLGTLYMLQNDIGLAAEAFSRSQSADPGFSHAWLGQGILALLRGNCDEARAYFTHAFKISDSTSIVTKRLFTTSTFDHILASPFTYDIADLLQPLFALHQLRTQVPRDLVSRHLSSLFSERIGNVADSIEILTGVSEDVEAEYEHSESQQALSQFAQAQADLARAYLAMGDIAAATEHATAALDLSAEKESGAHDPSARTKYRLSAHLTAGLAYYRSEDAGALIEMFRAALTDSMGDPDIVCLLAQVLWSKGNASERDVAREQLFDSIEKLPDHAGLVILLSAIALLDDDQDTIEAVAVDLQGLRTRADLDERELLRIGKLLEIFARLHPQTAASDPELAMQAEAATNIMLAPSKPHGWAQLAEVTYEPYAAEMALLTSSNAVPPKGSLTAEELSKAHAGTRTVADAQRAIMLTPWKAHGWNEFSDVAKMVG